MDLIEQARAVESEITMLAERERSSPDRESSWLVLLESLLRVSGCHGGFIGEVVESEIGIRQLATRAHVLTAPLPSDTALVVAQVMSGADFSIADTDGGARLITLPVSDGPRVAGVVGLVGDRDRIDASTSQLLGPLVTVVARIIRSLDASIPDQAEVELQDELSTLASVIVSAAYAMVVVDEEGNVEIANPAARTMLGLHEIELLGAPLVGLIDPTDLGWVMDIVESGGSEGTLLYRRTVTLLPESELAFRADLAVSSARVGGRRRSVLMFRSVESELEARAVARRAADLLAVTPDLVLWADRDGRIEYLNPGGRSLLGVDDCASIAVSDIFPAWAVDEFDRRIRPALYDGGNWTGDLAVVSASGEDIPVSVTFLFREEPGGAYLAAHARDLRHQRQLDLLHDAFVSTVSHELRTPLSSILGHLEMFGDGDFGPLSPEQQLSVDTMERNGRQLLDLVNRLLQVASVGESGAHDTGTVNLAGVAERLVASIEGWADRVEISCAEPDRTVVTGDIGQLESLLRGLIENGLKFSAPGDRVKVRLSRIDPWVQLVVEDRGMGIPETELASVFDRFFRASNARESETRGAGLGLAIARAIARQHRGEIAIESELGSGTTTRVLLPAAITESER